MLRSLGVTSFSHRARNQGTGGPFLLTMASFNRLHEDDFVYAGYSAGVCVLAPTLKGLHIADDPQAMPKGYVPQIIWTGLGFIPYCVAPHYRSNHSESPLIEKEIEYFIEQKIPFVALRDGEALILDSKTPLAF